MKQKPDTYGYAIVRGFRSCTVYVFRAGQLIGTMKRVPNTDLSRDQKKEQCRAFLQSFGLTMPSQLR